MLGAASIPSDIKSGDRIGIIATAQSKFDHQCIGHTTDGDDCNNQPESGPALSSLLQVPQLNFNYGDSLWPLYSMYCKIAQEDDNKITECCQKDADGTLIFMSPYVNILSDCTHKQENTDGFVHYHCWCIAYGLYPGPQAKSTRYICLLLGKYLSTFCQHQFV
jgi:hypothetical protein